MNWHLYKKDDPNTWPEIACPILVYYLDTTGKEHFEICVWGNRSKAFIEYDDTWGRIVLHGKTVHSWPPIQELYYAYIGYVPSGYKIFRPTICTNKKTGRLCDEYDDGYCMYRDIHPNCEHQKEINEYGIETKRIWKEFE